MRLSDPAVLIATWGGAGLAPRAPGTVGTLAALPFAALLHWAFGAFGPVALALAALCAYGAGIWACRRLLGPDPGEGGKDPGYIVIDEVVGVWIALLAAGLDWRLYVAGFALFRLFDIAKPWPISWPDRTLPGPHGVMLDDVLAGAAALAILLSLKQLMG